jgi:hypothetical protein
MRFFYKDEARGKTTREMNSYHTDLWRPKHFVFLPFRLNFKPLRLKIRVQLLRVKPGAYPGVLDNFILCNLKAFPMTETELKLIAAAASMGLRRAPVKG